jgi:hypothetical protein
MKREYVVIGLFVIALVCYLYAIVSASTTARRRMRKALRKSCEEYEKQQGFSVAALQQSASELGSSPRSRSEVSGTAGGD